MQSSDILLNAGYYIPSHRITKILKSLISLGYITTSGGTTPASYDIPLRFYFRCGIWKSRGTTDIRIRKETS